MVPTIEKDNSNNSAMSLKVKIKIKDRIVIDVRKAIKEAQSKDVVKAGVLESAGSYPDGLHAAEVATFHEFGTRDIPQRSFLRSTERENREALFVLFQQLTMHVLLRKMTANKALGLVGEKMKGLIQKKIANGDPNWKKLEDSTIAAKGSSKALIDTGQLRQSINYEVVKK